LRCHRNSALVFSDAAVGIILDGAAIIIGADDSISLTNIFGRPVTDSIVTIIHAAIGNGGTGAKSYKTDTKEALFCAILRVATMPQSRM
jgi:hypothetical protein